ncbi:hypothetical protein [Kitasatospora sp. NPDC056531]|uniref:hypothetical protein n=1 Tax=Kitasatospora sp. NPDC056531 TaxID=3345856 RepID=UPI0036872A70
MTDRHARLLLLLPVLGDSAVPAGAVDTVTEALIAQGAPEGCSALARRLLGGHPMWGAQPWWFDADERSWICDGEHSPRQTPLGDHLPQHRRTDLESCLRADPNACTVRPQQRSPGPGKPPVHRRASGP